MWLEALIRTGEDIILITGAVLIAVGLVSLVLFKDLGSPYTFGAGIVFVFFREFLKSVRLRNKPRED